jgi:hypothetical protein
MRPSRLDRGSPSQPRSPRRSASQSRLAALISGTARTSQCQAAGRPGGRWRSFRSWADDNPAIPQYQRHLTLSLTRIGKLQQEAGHGAEAADASPRICLGGAIPSNPAGTSLQ